MTPAYFPKANLMLGDEQPEYLLLPAHRAQDGVFTTCWELDDADLAEIVKTRRVWTQQMTFGTSFQPLIVRADAPELT